MLCEAGFDVDYVTEDGSPLHMAALSAQVDTVQFLLSRGANPLVRDNEGKTVVERLDQQEVRDEGVQCGQDRDKWVTCRRLLEGR